MRFTKKIHQRKNILQEKYDWNFRKKRVIEISRYRRSGAKGRANIGRNMISSLSFFVSSVIFSVLLKTDAFFKENASVKNIPLKKILHVMTNIHKLVQGLDYDGKNVYMHIILTSL